MQQYTFGESKEVYSNKLDIFTPLQQDCGVLNREYVPIYPISPVTQRGAIAFKIPGSNGGYIDTSKSYIYLEVKIVKADGKTQIDANDNVCLTNLCLYSVFSQVNGTLNGQYINSSIGPHFAHDRYLDVLHNQIYDGGPSSRMCMMGYFQDDENNIRSTNSIQRSGQRNEEGELVTMVNSPTVNEGVRERALLTSTGQTAHFSGPLGVDYLDNLDKVLVNGVDINLEYFQSNDEFRLLANSNTINYKLVISEMIIYACYLRVRPEIMISHSEKFNSKNDNLALYYYSQFKWRSFNVPKGLMKYEVHDIFSDLVPNKVEVVIVDAVAASGSYESNGLVYEHLNVNSISFSIDGRSVPNPPMSLSFGQNQATEAFNAFVRSSLNSSELATTTTEFENGRTVFVFDVNSSDESGVYPLLKRGSTRLSISFATPIPKSVVVMVRGSFTGSFSVSATRAVTIHQ